MRQIENMHRGLMNKIVASNDFNNKLVREHAQILQAIFTVILEFWQATDASLFFLSRHIKVRTLDRVINSPRTNRIPLVSDQFAIGVVHVLK